MIDLSQLKPRKLKFDSRNAIVYAVNDNQTYVDCMVNSINSICVNSKDILDRTCFFVITDKDIDLSRLRPEAASRTRTLAEMSYDYSSFPIKSRHTKYTFFRYEMFVNPIFHQFDHLLYLDVDTQIEASIQDLFQDSGPKIEMVEEYNNLLAGSGAAILHYCNAGVIHLTPKEIGTGEMKDMFGFLVEQTKKAMRHNDQDALNMMLADKRWSSLHHVLGSEWNYGYATMEKAPPSGHIRIRHFISSKGKYLKKYL